MLYYRFPSFRPTPPSETKTAQECLAEILSRSESQRRRCSLSNSTQISAMPSSKGKPTDPRLWEEVKEGVRKESKGGGPGSWSAWKASEMAKQYEARGGDYEDTGDNKNKSQKGAPERKSGRAKKEDDKKK